MLRALPRNRTRLRVIVGILLPAYLTLWIAGTGCIGELYWYASVVESCVFSMALGFLPGTLTGQEIEVLTVTSGVNVYLPLAQLTVSGSSDDAIAELRAALLFYTALGVLVQSVDMIFSTTTGIVGSADVPGVMMAPGDYFVLSVFMSALLSQYFAVFSFTPLDEIGTVAPVFAFPPQTAKAKFALAFDARFGVDYAIPDGRLKINGSVELPEGAEASIPRKVIVEIAHLAADGDVLARHKQTVKVKRNGTFKTSSKRFRGFDMEAGDRVRLRLKPKKGDLDGLNWMLMPELVE